jgi:hypothetical protein
LNSDDARKNQNPLSVIVISTGPQAVELKSVMAADMILDTVI